ncbi:N-acetylmuramoyl-L-alanine amidase [Oceanisphaera avium]|uniref:N-acetylmuramoyl-L-alanine amidase n=1 Tax=Oceanisphaera avium TaxID=1903694 RepID=A0A1Y0CVF8_9GAMM|nr:N-acetylmuramoyl-L-alanine amidase [Oceanisphaera avium]ART79323.1 N-acetylmuramoyl-L-alanine amidase [Oceanisphaera avium]
MKLYIVLAAAWLLAACSSSHYNDSYRSIGQDSRVQFIVLHYTSSDLSRSLKVLTQGQVSSHYLINNNPATVYRLVDENKRAWHAGNSEWAGRTWLNSSSIGIEMVNHGYRLNAAGRREWQVWSEPQIKALIILLKDIMRRHGLTARSVVGHSDIAPQRKVDPGPLFPWHKLAAEGLILWPEPKDVARHTAKFSQQLPSITWFQEQLALIGYAVPRHGKLDKATQNVVAAFQMKYRPQLHNGQPDAQTAAMLLSLTHQLH